MRRATRKLAHRLHFLRLAQCRLDRQKFARALENLLLKRRVEAGRVGLLLILVFEVGIGADPQRDATKSIPARISAFQKALVRPIRLTNAKLDFSPLTGREGVEPGCLRTAEVVGMHCPHLCLRVPAAAGASNRGSADAVRLVTRQVVAGNERSTSPLRPVRSDALFPDRSDALLC